MWTPQASTPSNSEGQAGFRDVLSRSADLNGRTQAVHTSQSLSGSVNSKHRFTASGGRWRKARLESHSIRKNFVNQRLEFGSECVSDSSQFASIHTKLRLISQRDQSCGTVQCSFDHGEGLNEALFTLNSALFALNSAPLRPKLSPYRPKRRSSLPYAQQANQAACLNDSS